MHDESQVPNEGQLYYTISCNGFPMQLRTSSIHNEECISQLTYRIARSKRPQALLHWRQLHLQLLQSCVRAGPVHEPSMFDDWMVQNSGECVALQPIMMQIGTVRNKPTSRANDCRPRNKNHRSPWKSSLVAVDGYREGGWKRRGFEKTFCVMIISPPWELLPTSGLHQLKGRTK